MSTYYPIIGLEIHVELKTKSKMFCQCSAEWFGKEPNTHVCPVCLGLPGALPVPNQKAIEWTILIGKALNCTINSVSKFDRKHYFYPDLPKGYQISQYDEPIAVNGYLILPSSPTSHSSPFRIRRVHLEEDTGKLTHEGTDTLIDFNRSGVPLVEIVSEPDFNNTEDVKRFLEELYTIIRYLDVSDADMEKGTMRLEPNISVMLAPSFPFYPPYPPESLPNYKVEVKNINSFSFVRQAIEYEVKRHIGLLEKGETPKQETRGFDEKNSITYSQRSKEEAHEYRYFPEPDIPPLEFSSQYIKKIALQLPELPQQKVQRYQKEFGLRYQEAFILTREKQIAEYFEELSAKFKAKSEKLPFKTKNVEQSIANLIVNKKIPFNPLIPLTSQIDHGVKQITYLLTPKQTDPELLEIAINKVISANPKVITDYKKGKQNAIMFLIGQVMREMKGKADANVVKEELTKKI